VVVVVALLRVARIGYRRRAWDLHAANRPCCAQTLHGVIADIDAAITHLERSDP